MHERKTRARRKAVLEVHTVELSVLESKPPKLSIRASGSVPAGDWAEPVLIPHIYLQGPSDGIYDFTMTACLNEESDRQESQMLEATHVLSPLPEDLVGVRIHASSSSKVALLGDPSLLTVEGELTDEGVVCQALRGQDGELYTLTGDLQGYSAGDKVRVTGSVAGISICQQGTTIDVSAISGLPPWPRKD